MNNLAALDLNLLVVLDALLRERSVSQAARRLGRSQPAVSNALARLRAALGDPLLVRGGQGMAPTPRALALQGPVREALAALEAALAGDRFDPGAARLRVRIAADDYVGLALLPAALGAIRREAPGVDVEVLARGAPSREDVLRRGEADLAVGYFARLEPDLRYQDLFAEEFRCLLRADHPALAAPLTPAAFAALPHLIVSPRGGARGVVDDALAALGLRRRVALAVPHFLAAPAIVAQTDCVVTLARRLAEGFARTWPLAVLSPPVPLAPYAIALAWHPRAEDAAAHRWLRGVFSETAAEVGGWRVIR